MRYSEDIKYLQIVYDDINQLIELIESYRDKINSARDLYIANVSLQMNNTMRIITIFNTISLPLTGCSRNMWSQWNRVDEHNWSGRRVSYCSDDYVGYYFSLLFFKKKRWIFDSDDDFNSVVKKEKYSDNVLWCYIFVGFICVWLKIRL